MPNPITRRYNSLVLAIDPGIKDWVLAPKLDKGDTKWASTKHQQV